MLRKHEASPPILFHCVLRVLCYIPPLVEASEMVGAGLSGESGILDAGLSEGTRLALSGVDCLALRWLGEKWALFPDGLPGGVQPA